MRYVCLIYIRETDLAGIPAADLETVERECVAWEAALQAGGQLLGVEALLPVRAATTVRVRNGRTLVTDGPFAETHEQLAGLYLIDARDLNDAIRIAARIPPARFGGVEVRPLRESV